MAIYMIGYDLHPRPAETYDEFYSAIETLGSGYWDCLDSTWLVITERNAIEIHKELRRYLKPEDRLLVMRYGNNAAWSGFEDACETWLLDHM